MATVFSGLICTVEFSGKAGSWSGNVIVIVNASLDHADGWRLVIEITKSPAFRLVFAQLLRDGHPNVYCDAPGASKAVKPAMDLRPRMLIRTSLFVFCLGCASAAMAGEDSPYPVWWSPALELESLEKIDERLERKFWPDSSDGIRVVKGEWPGDSEAFIDDCVSYDKLTNEGYYTTSNHDNKSLMFHSSICYALEMLASAKSSLISYVNRFEFDQNSIAYLPAMVSSSGSSDFACRQYVANERRIPWSKFEVFEFENIDIIHDYEMKVATTGERLTLQIVARADFNNDGMEDLMLRVNSGAVGGTWGTTEIILTTRDSPNGVLWVLDAEKSLSPNYRCQETYDYPDALRESN